MAERTVSPGTVNRQYEGPEDVYEELVGDNETSWLLALVAFAVVCSGLICTDTSIGGKFTIRGKLDEKRSQKI